MFLVQNYFDYFGSDRQCGLKNKSAGMVWCVVPDWKNGYEPWHVAILDAIYWNLYTFEYRI
jgi:hypothetical protein